MTATPAWPSRLRSQGERERRGGHQPLSLVDPSRVWMIERGRVELFLVGVGPDGREGARQHLATVPEGGMLLGIAGASGADFGLIAVPHVDTDLLSWPVALIHAEAGEPDVLPLVAAALESWLRALSQGMAHWAWPRPAIGHGLEPGQSVSIPMGRRVSGTRTLVWVQIDPTAASYLDLQALPENGASIRFPLAPEAWLLCDRAVELGGCDTVEAVASGVAWSGVANLHQILFDAAARNLQLAKVDEFNRLRARRAATEAARDHAFEDLMAATTARGRPPAAVDHEEPPLLSALRLIGREEGFEVHASLSPQFGESPSLETLARTNGLRMRAIVLRDDWWRHDFGTLLVFDVTTGQPLVLLSGGRSRSRLVEPQSGQDLPFAPEQIAPRAWELTGHLPPQPIGLRRFLGAAVRRGERDLLSMLTLGAITAALSLTTPVATAYLIDRVIPNHDHGLLIQLGVVLVVLGATAFALTYVGTLSYSRAESRIGRVLQSGLVDRVLRLPMGFFQAYSTGDLGTRLLAMTQVQIMISTASVNAILSGVFGVFSFLLMFAYDTRLALWAGLLTVVYVAFSLQLAFLRLHRERLLAEITGRVNNRILQLILGVAKIRLAAAEDRAFARWARIFAQGRPEQLATLRLGAWQGALNQILPLTGLLLFVILIGKPGEQPDLSAVGAFSALLVAFLGFTVSLANMLLAVTQLLAVRPQLERVRPLLAAEPEVIAGDKPDPGPLSGAIEISHLRFRYELDGPLILDDVSLAITPGDFVALVGPSGSGKSTLIRLLLGFETPEAGGILFDGQSLASIDATAVRRQMGVVMQRSELMPRSLFENIVGTTGATQDDAWEAAEQVGLADDIRQMPMGMQTVILEGDGALSGGQMQRLMIARAIVSRPKILLLDEATSALDNRTQAIVTESLDRLRVSRLVVAHRLSTVVNADRIYVIQGGRIVESGIYADLMAANGLFAHLAERQQV